MAGEKYVPSGVWLTCDKGSTTSQFISTPKTVKLYGEDYGTEADLVPMVNIQSFGTCSIDGSACIPQPVQWLDVFDGGTTITYFKPLLDCSQCLCAKTGKAIIHISRGAADAHLAAEGIHKAADVAKEVSMWAFIGGVVLGVAAVACAFTGVGAVATPFLLAAAGECMEVAAVSFEVGIALDATAFAVEPTKANGWVLVGDAAALLGGKIIGKGLGILAEDLAATGLGRKITVIIEDGSSKVKDPIGTERTPTGKLRDAKTKKFVTDPNAKPSAKYRRSMSERKKALLRDEGDPNSRLSDDARQFIKDTKGKNVPEGYEVHHKKPLAMSATLEGKANLDKAGNMETIPKSEHTDLHVRCGDAFHLIKESKKN
ncbi:hypothetical protein ABIB40_003201 [Pedobacter sp. UYP30]|uniref:PAAR-like protein n=1 Tax=Pedobacter sp. UYP30 TaxID=1756400 RepID=UPI003393D943